MNELRALLSVELRSLYGINRMLHTRDPKEKKRYRIQSIAWAILIAMAFFYVGGLVYGLCTLGLGSIVPAYLVVVASMLILVFNLFSAGNRIFGQRGYDIVASMPFPPGTVVASRFLTLYVGDLTFVLAIMLPGIGVYGYLQQPHAGFYLFAILVTAFLPAIPLVIAALFGTAMLAFSSRMKHKSLVQSALSVLLVVGVMICSFSMEGLLTEVTPEQLAQLAQRVGELIGRLYPPALWVNRAMTQPSVLHLLLFILVSLGVMALAYFITARYFHAILRRLNSFTAKHSYTLRKMERRSLLRALYQREVKRYFSSSIYVTNTVVGPILGCIMAVALWVAGVDPVQTAIGLPVDIPALLPFAFSAVFCTMTTTSVAVSMEGRQFWVVKSLPIPTKTLLDSKILLNLSLMLPFYLVAEGAMILALKPDLWQLLYLLLIPAVIALFSVVFGIAVNLKLCRFDWENEAAVVKQSVSAALGGFGGFFASVLLAGAALLTPEPYGNGVKALLCLAVLGITALLYRKNNRAVLSRL